MKSKFISEVQRSAEESFASGLYCAESDVLPKLATAFCSGMARTCGPCGALTGAVMGVSLALGRSKAAEFAARIIADSKIPPIEPITQVTEIKSGSLERFPEC